MGNIARLSTMKKKLLFMLSSMNIGGVEKSFLSLLSALPKRDYDITVLLLEKKGGFLDYIPDGVKVKEATWYKKIKPIIMQPPKQTLYSLFKNNQLSKIPSFLATYIFSKIFNDRYSFYDHVLKEINIGADHYDIAVAFQGPTDIIDFYIANKVKANKRISWVHFDVTQHFINKKLYAKLYKKFNEIYAVSELAKTSLIETIPTIRDKVSVKKTFISSEVIKNMSDVPVNFDKEFNGIRIVTVGRLSDEKGQDMAIRVQHKLRQAGYNVRWYCVGEGNSREALKKMIEQYHLRDSFYLLGATPNPYPYMKMCDIYVQPSKHEGFCLTLAEAKMLNKPIVTTDFLGAYEQLDDGYNGLISKNEKEIYKHIESLIQAPSNRTYLEENLMKTDPETSLNLTNLF